MSIFSKIKDKAAAIVQNTTRNVPTNLAQVKALEKKVENKIKKAADDIQKDLKKVGGGLSVLQLANYAPVLPFFFVMKKALDKKGIKYDRNNIADVSKKFANNIIGYNFGGSFYGGVDTPINYNAVPVFSYNENEYNIDGNDFESLTYNAETAAEGGGFDPNNSIGKLLGGLGGTAAATAAAAGATAGTAGAGAGSVAAVPVGAAVGTAAGGGAEMLVKKIVQWFSTLLKKKKDGTLTGEDALAIADEAGNALAGMTPEEAAAHNAIGQSGFLGMSTTTLIIIAVALAAGAFLLLRKK